jgi:rod shape determining protein RodA
MRTDRVTSLLRRFDPVTLLVLLALAVISVTFIYSASYRGPGQPMPDFHRMQMVWFGIGGVLFLVAALVDYRLICQWATFWYALAVVLLLVVLFAGVRVYGAKRWLGIGGLGIQPAELAKLAVIVGLAYYLFHRTPAQRLQWTTMGGALVLLVVPFVLIVVEPDLGSALALVPIAAGMLYAAGVRVKHLVVVAVLGLCLSPVAWLNLRKYQRDRLTVFLHPNRDPLGAGWNLNQSLIAVGSGGVTGKGYLQGTQNLLGYLPRTVTPNDFLFSVIAEEKGFIGSLGVVGLYAVLLLRGLRIAACARDRLGMLLATGIVVMLFFHVFVNLGMTIGMMPVKGVPLPLLSYGGSFVLVTMTALGLLQNVWIHRRNY